MANTFTYILRIDDQERFYDVRTWLGHTPIEQVQRETLAYLEAWDKASDKYYESRNRSDLGDFPCTSEGCDFVVILPNRNTMTYIDKDMNPDGIAYWEFTETESNIVLSPCEIAIIGDVIHQHVYWHKAWMNYALEWWLHTLNNSGKFICDFPFTF